MKNVIITAIVAITFASCNNAEKKTETTTSTENVTVTPDDNPTVKDSAVDMNKQAGTETAGKNVIYTCTMHPEVQQDKPGKCPKCGMELVVKK